MTQHDDLALVGGTIYFKQNAFACGDLYGDCRMPP